LVFWRSSSGTERLLESFAAPNFTLPDLNGKLHSLADFRGKESSVGLLGFPGGGCRFDLQVAGFYKELRDRNFEIISVAQDTGGAKDAGPWITAAKPEYTALIDERQIVSRNITW